MPAIKSNQEKLDDLKAVLMIDNPSPALAHTATKIVFGSGNPHADIVFIGEAPGKREDATGEPFVGAAGRLLDQMLAMIGLKRSDIYITNIVKYRPPNNRDPLPAEKKAFWPYLEKQLAIINPKAIVTLGRHSGQAFIQDLRISADHGRPQRLPISLAGNQREVTILPLYHPAAALYNGGLRSTLFADFKQIEALI